MIKRFLSVVPKGVRTTALILVVCGTLIGLTVGCFWPYIQHHHHFFGGAASTLGILGCTGVGVLFGSFMATWLLCLGYVYADARRRAMHPVLWLLVALFVPHLLGFLFYFVLRQPVASTCPHCGQTISINQRFCSWCGQPHTPQPPPASGGVRPVVS